MRARNALAVKSGGNRIEGRNDRSRGKRDRLAPKQPNRQAAVPDTVMAHAFLLALRRWLSARRTSSQKIAIPTGVVSDDELVRVLRALFSGVAP